ncbi:hypothetical protein RRG08_032211 [Elysia crispata]|uniref:Uncharacterized protein n=1 Tax=Elysia crispata TaxID=231223 RepID=A0AAE1ABX6_9GAST|nr:hypothetical protein RRG08_032211 [Elysia crispata]
MSGIPPNLIPNKDVQNHIPRILSEIVRVAVTMTSGYRPLFSETVIAILASGQQTQIKLYLQHLARREVARVGSEDSHRRSFVPGVRAAMKGRQKVFTGSPTDLMCRVTSPFTSGHSFRHLKPNSPPKRGLN